MLTRDQRRRAADQLEEVLAQTREGSEPSRDRRTVLAYIDGVIVGLRGSGRRRNASAPGDGS